jgi:hypothetical protein
VPKAHDAVNRIVAALLVFVGLVNFLPVTGVLSAEILADAYGLPAPTGDLLVLLRHRALLFGIVGAFIIVAAFRRHLQPAAMLAGFVSMLGFVVLTLASGDYGAELRRVAIIDMIALPALVIAAVLRLRKPKDT